MTDIQVPPLHRPTPAQLSEWENWTEKELLVAQVIRINAIAGMMVKMATDMPDMMRSPMVKMAMKLLIKSDKSSE